MNEWVTYYSSHKSEVVQPVKLEQVLAAFKNGRFAGKILEVRKVLEQQGDAKYKEAKRSLPAVAFCGVFAGGHAKENLVKYNNLLVFDIDHLTVEEMRLAYSKMASDTHILAFWVSPSGSGYKGLIRVDYCNVPEGSPIDRCYKKAYKDASVYFQESLGVTLDSSCSDYSRICYVCWDENLYLNVEAVPFNVDCNEVSIEEKSRPVRASFDNHGGSPGIFRPINASGKNKQHDRDLIGSVIKYLSKRGLSITRSYDEWLRVGFAIASTFNYDLGLKYFIALSKLDGDKYDETQCAEKLQECYMSGKGEVTLGTIVEMARNKGYKGSSEDI